MICKYYVPKAKAALLIFILYNADLFVLSLNKKHYANFFLFRPRNAHASHKTLPLQL